MLLNFFCKWYKMFFILIPQGLNTLSSIALKCDVFVYKKNKLMESTALNGW